VLRTIDVLMVALLLGGAAFTYKIKHDSEVAIERVAELERKIKSEQDAIDVLLADWSLLTSPARLEKLVAKYREELGLEEVVSTQIGTIDEVPAKLKLPSVDSDRGIAGLLSDEDQLTTGAIEKVVDQ